MPRQFSPAVHNAVVTALEFIRIVVGMPKTREKILTEMDLSDSAFDDEIDVLENMLAAADDKHERMVPRLSKHTNEEDD